MGKLQTKTRDTGYYIKVIIGLAIMFGVQFLPAPDPITKCGMALLGIFFGLIFMYATLDILWPNMFAILLMSLYLFDIYPNAAGDVGIVDVGQRVFGGEIPCMLIGIFLVSYACEEAGVIRRLAVWFITRKVARKGAWSFTFMIFLATFVIGLFFDVTPLTVIMLTIAHTAFEIMGFKKGDAWPKAVVCGITWIACITYACSPVGHNVPILFTGLLANVTGYNVSMLSYLAVGLPIAAVISILLYLYFRFVLKPDVTPFENADYTGIEQMRPGKMSKHEKGIAIISAITLALMIFPGIFDIIVPGNLFSSIIMTKLSGQGTWTLFAAVALMCAIRTEGRPLLNLSEGLSKISWTIVVMVGTIVTVSFAMNEPTTGVATWVSNILSPVFSGMTPFIAIALICLACIIVTNILNNVAVGMVFITVASAVLPVVDVHPAVLSIAIMICSQLGYTTAAAFPTIGFATGDEYCNAPYVLKNGVILTVISLIVCIPLLFPLASLVF